MKDLKINSTLKTPEIDFNLSTGVFLISGVSVPENSIEFYKDAKKWLGEFAKSPKKTSKIVFKLSYINTSSLQAIYDLLMILDGVNEKKSDIKVDWYYLEEDLDMYETGKDFDNALSFDFSFIEVESV